MLRGLKRNKSTKTAQRDDDDGNNKGSEPTGTFWRDGFSDPLTGLPAYSSCITTLDVTGDGTHELVIADIQGRLQVWKGQHKTAALDIAATCAALVPFVPSKPKDQPAPCLAVAVGSCITYYCQMQTVARFQLPAPPASDAELQIWQQMTSGQLSYTDARTSLTNLLKGGTSLTPGSLELLTLTEPEEVDHFVARHAEQPLVFDSDITCMDLLRRIAPQDGQVASSSDAAGHIIVGTANGAVLLLTHDGLGIQTAFRLPSTPAFLAALGAFNGPWRVFIATQHASLHIVENGKLLAVVVHLDALPAGLVRVNNGNAIVGLTNGQLVGYSPNGRRVFSTPLPSPLVTMTHVDIPNAKHASFYAAALADGQVRIYNEWQVLNTFSTDQPCWGLHFARWGRDTLALICMMRNGALCVKTLAPNAPLQPLPQPASHTTSSTSALVGIGKPPVLPPPSAVALQRLGFEAQHSAEVHSAFQWDCARMRLTTARAYSNLLVDGKASVSHGQGGTLSLLTTLAGLGPLFSLRVTLQNKGRAPVHDLTILTMAPGDIYQLPQGPLRMVPLLLPLGSTTVEVPLVFLASEPCSADVCVYVFGEGKGAPMLSAHAFVPVPLMVDV